MSDRHPATKHTQTTSESEMRSASRRAVIRVTVTLGAATILACRAVTSPPRTAVPTATPSIAEIERWARLKMPATAQDVHAYVDARWLDALVVLTFKLPAGNLAPFLREAGYEDPLRPPESTLDIPGYYEEFDRRLPGYDNSTGLPWWPSTADWNRMLDDPERVLLFGDVFKASFSRTILVDQTDPDLYTIYLYHSEV